MEKTSNKQKYENQKLDKKIFAHEQLRKKLWCDAWTLTASANDCKSPETATRWADNALKDFDKRFNQPNQ
jgi:hypothetical protein